MSGHTTQISPFFRRGGAGAAVVGQGLPITSLPSPEIIEGLRLTREDLIERGELPPDITEDEMAVPITGAGLKLNTTLAKFFPDLAREKLSRTDIFPGFQGARAVGEVTGQFIGRQPLIVATGGLFPVEIVEARKRALQAGAAKNLAIQAAFLEFPDTDKVYENQIKELGFNLVVEGGQKVNWNFSALFDLSSPIARDFQKDMLRLNSLADELIKAPEMARNIIADAATKDKFVPDNVRKAAVAINSGFIDAKELFEDPAMFKQIISPLVSFNNTTNVIRTEIMPNLERGVDELVPELSDEAQRTILTTNDFDLIATTIKKVVDRDLIRSWAEKAKTDFGLQDDVDDIEDLLFKTIGERIKETIRTGRKFNLAARSLKKKQQTIPGAGRGVTNIETQLFDTEGFVTKTTVLPLEHINSFGLAGTGRAPKGINILPDEIFLVNKTEFSKGAGALNVDFIEVVDLAFSEQGFLLNNIVTGELPDVLPPSTVIKRSTIVIVNEDNKSFGVKAGETILVPWEDTEQQLKNARITIEKGQLIIEPLEGESLESRIFGLTEFREIQ